MTIQENYIQVKNQIPEAVQLVAVSKTHPVEKIRQIYDAGQKIFGENKVQELLSKYENLPSDIEWHLIGHLQTNKVKYIAPFIHTIQSVDSEKLLAEINKQAQLHGRTITVLLQIKIAEEDTKFGMTFEDCDALLEKLAQGDFPHVAIRGLMGMASFVEDETQIEREFTTLKKYFDQKKKDHPLQYLSMGMSGDYPLAISCGSNSVRIGSAIFGERNYTK
ncbi:YggS family pyridoxal phosphate-dependent enzyme [Bergeyella zoohelcum]|uniref:Pyridoxal phosphate homeostasis protein n=1 Tax=Bergeyella zoohelcum ATCC 43767 TaxID=883096 RepID=K1MHK8_9FLAO|nr:YggS family pyridoxal phosphate-dependent enzyme [Bergeyella zoohelcum]EKB55479.1 YggS family pyridoxal phosphate enzyme [Bergeyella zoohelcum ATCC 43767]SUV50128.1 Predicted enzyme with a TIM-barrel fold [Bergeyella zoohelcum]